jgi:hypothetical protein
MEVSGATCSAFVPSMLDSITSDVVGPEIQISSPTVIDKFSGRGFSSLRI